MLEIGCGTGILTLELCKRGAEITSIDISANAIDIAHNRIINAGFNKRVNFLNNAFEMVKLPEKEFDLTFGKWILHHLNFKQSIDNIYLYLKPNGRAIFIETSYLNPVIKLIRKYLVGKLGIRKIGTIDEKPLGHEEISYVKHRFKKVNLYFPEFSFFWLFDRHILQYKKCRSLGRFLNDMDREITLHLPKLRKYGYYLILECVK